MNLDTAKREVLSALRGATGRAHIDRMVATSDVRDRLPAAVDACLESGMVTYRDGQKVNLTGGVVRRVAALYLPRGATWFARSPFEPSKYTRL